MPAALDPIFQALCLILAEQPDRVAWSGWTDADWERFNTTARLERVAPLVYYILERLGEWSPVPPELRRKLRAAYDATMAQNLIALHELARILVPLDTHAIVLKGPSLALTLYPNLALRPLGDLDLLLPRASIQKSAAALEKMGYVEEQYLWTAPSVNRAVGYHVALQRGAEHIVELHWNLVGSDADWRSPSLDWFWSQTEPLTLGPNVTALMFTPTGQLLYLAAHLMLQHGAGDARLLWFYDIHLLLESWSARVDWDQLLTRAAEFRWSDALHRALQETRARFNTPISDEFLRALAATSDTKAARLIARKARSSPLRGPKYWHTFSTLNGSARFRFVAGMLFPNPAFMRWRYRLRTMWLVPLYYPLRWLEFLRDNASSLGRRI